jgi:hypothetical protein
MTANLNSVTPSIPAAQLMTGEQRNADRSDRSPNESTVPSGASSTGQWYAQRAREAGGVVPVGNGWLMIPKAGDWQQNGGWWQDLRYRFGPGPTEVVPYGQKLSVGEVGCTATAFLNAAIAGLRIANPSARIPTPADANGFTSNKEWNRAMSCSEWKSLRPLGKSNIYDGMRNPVAINSSDGRQLLTDIRREVAQGRPVVLGLDRGAGRPRHSVLVVGYNPSKQGWDSLMIRDNWRGPTGSGERTSKTQSAFLTDGAEVINFYEAKKIDIAVSAIPRGRCAPLAR